MRYFFHVNDGVRLVNDTAGSVLPTDELAMQNGHKLAIDVAGSLSGKEHISKGLFVLVKSEDGAEIGKIPLSDYL